MPPAEQAMQGLSLGHGQAPPSREQEAGPGVKEQQGPKEQGQGGPRGQESNGGPPPGGQSQGANQGGPGKKMSWASIASQPAKPPPPPSKAKKPGVLQVWNLNFCMFCKNLY